MHRFSPALLVSLALASFGCTVPEPDRDLRLAAEAKAKAAAASASASASTSTSTSVAKPPSPAFTPVRVSLEDKAMGTRVVLTAFTSEAINEASIRPMFEKALAEIRRLEALMTTWRPDTELSQINAAAGKKAIKVSPESLSVIQKSVWTSKQSEGVFDITFEAMHGLWKFDEDLEDNIPPASAISAARALIDYRKIKIDPDKSTVMLEKPGMRMSLGGIAKGYAIDAAARILGEAGLTSFFAQAGGDLYVRGRKPDGSAWRTGVRDPRGKNENDVFASLEVEDHAFSTAGDYERSFIKDGKRYHHIIDPRTGYPATASRSVTVWAKDAFTADAIDDAVFILGPEKGLKLVESIDDCGAVIVDEHNKVWISSRLKPKLQVFRPPTDGI
jgi:FAD:protein FMN transferase